MAKKPVDHDATMDLSMSQLVVDEPPRAPPRPAAPAAGDTNDMSLWAYRVVGSEDFAPAPVKQGQRARAWLIVMLLVVTLGAAGVLVYRYFL